MSRSSYLIPSALFQSRWTAWEGIVYHPPRDEDRRIDRPGAGSMSKIFLSYRRQDSAGVAGQLYDRSRTHFGDDAIFMDIDSIPFGVDFREHIQSEPGAADGD